LYRFSLTTGVAAGEHSVPLTIPCENKAVPARMPHTLTDGVVGFDGDDGDDGEDGEDEELPPPPHAAIAAAKASTAAASLALRNRVTRPVSSSSLAPPRPPGKINLGADPGNRHRVLPCPAMCAFPGACS